MQLEYNQVYILFDILASLFDSVYQILLNLVNQRFGFIEQSVKDLSAQVQHEALQNEASPHQQHVGDRSALLTVAQRQQHVDERAYEVKTRGSQQNCVRNRCE